MSMVCKEKPTKLVGYWKNRYPRIQPKENAKGFSLGNVRVITGGHMKVINAYEAYERIK